MPDRWTPTPQRAPYKCPFTQQDKPEDGPYFEARLFYFDAMVDQARGGFHPGRHPQQLYMSRQAIIEACELAGSPLKAMTRDEYEDLLTAGAVAREECAELRIELEEAQAELELLRAGPPVDVEQLAESLSSYFQRKTGPKPKATA